MATSANIRKVQAMSGPGYFREIGKARARNYGHTESISWEARVETRDLFSSIEGTPEKFDQILDTIGAGGEIVLRQTSVANMVAQFAGEAADYVQQEAIAEIVSGTDARAGDMIRLSHQAIATLDLGGLVEGVDYSLDASAGVIEFLTDAGDYNGTYSAPAILADQERQIISILSRPEGVVGELTVVQKQKRGDRYMIVLPKVVMRPSGPISLSREGTEEATITLTFECLADTTQPADKRYGYVVKLA